MERVICGQILEVEAGIGCVNRPMSPLVGVVEKA
jgi:hypothetical protein